MDPVRRLMDQLGEINQTELHGLRDNHLNGRRVVLMYRDPLKPERVCVRLKSEQKSISVRETNVCADVTQTISRRLAALDNIYEVMRTAPGGVPREFEDALQPAVADMFTTSTHASIFTRPADTRLVLVMRDVEETYLPLLAVISMLNRAYKDVTYPDTPGAGLQLVLATLGCIANAAGTPCTVLKTPDLWTLIVQSVLRCGASMVFYDRHRHAAALTHTHTLAVLSSAFTTTTVLEDAALMFANLSTHVDSRPVLAQLLPEVANALDRGPNPNSVTYMLTAVANIAFDNESDAVCLRLTSIISRRLLQMTQSRDETTVRHTCVAIANICNNIYQLLVPTSLSTLLGTDVIESLFSALRVWGPTDPRFPMYIFGALTSIFQACRMLRYVSPELRQIDCDDTVTRIVEALTTHAKVHDTVHTVLRFVSAMTYTGRNLNLICSFYLRLVSAGGMAAIIDTINVPQPKHIFRTASTVLLQSSKLGEIKCCDPNLLLQMQCRVIWTWARIQHSVPDWHLLCENMLVEYGWAAEARRAQQFYKYLPHRQTLVCMFCLGIKQRAGVRQDGRALWSLLVDLPEDVFRCGGRRSIR